MLFYARISSMPLALLCLGLGCADDVASSESSSGAGSATVTVSATGSTGSSTGTGSDTGTASATQGSGSEGETSTGAMTTGSTGVSASASDSSSGSSSGGDCVCEPGETMGCEGDLLVICREDCSGFESLECEAGVCMDGACTDLFCNPGESVCEDLGSYKTCDDEGKDYGDPVPCGETEECSGGTCIELCELVKLDASSIGCVFRANKMQNFKEEPSALAIGNVSETLTASVTLYYNDNVVSGPIQVMPGKSHVFDLAMPSQPGPVSVLRATSTFKAVSDVPVVAYLHSPIQAEAHNDSSMLLPDHAQRQNFIAAAYKPNVGGNPAYINIIGLEGGTEVSWTPPVATAAGTGVPAVAANGTGMVTIGDYDLLQISSGQSDLSGTVISSSKPIWVVAAVQCVNIPNGVTYCDHIEEQMIPLDYWGETYVGAHAPTRGSESFHWRIYGGDEGVTVSTEPPQAGFPVTLGKGEFYEFKTKVSVIFSADGPFMPVQYLEGQDGGAGTGDPASYQMVPVEQFLTRYAFVTGVGYSKHYAQVVRTKGGAEVLIDGATVTGYDSLGAYEIADWPISEGAHLAESGEPFGIYQVGYTGVTSYAYPGGLRLKVINPQ